VDTQNQILRLAKFDTNRKARLERGSLHWTQ